MLIIVFFSLLLVALGCETTNEVTENTNEVTLSSTIEENPLFIEDSSIIYQLTLNEEFISILKTHEKIHYIDDATIVYEDQGNTIVLSNGETNSFSVSSTSYPETNSNFFFLGYDNNTKTIYYYDSSYSNRDAEYISKTGISKDSENYVTFMSTMHFFSPFYTVTGHYVRNYGTNTLFSNGEAIAFLNLKPGDNFRFYTYNPHRGTEEKGCQIKTYTSFILTDFTTQNVHDEYNCGEIALQTEENIVIELVKNSSHEGYVIIDNIGVAHTFIFADYLPEGTNVSFNSEKIYYLNPEIRMPSFSYKDSENNSHTVVADLNYTFVQDVQNINTYRYIDPTYRISNIYQVWDYERYTETQIEFQSDRVFAKMLSVLDDYFIFQEMNMGTGPKYYSTLFNRTTREIKALEGLVLHVIGTIAIIKTDSGTIIYDLQTDETLATYEGMFYWNYWDGYLLLHSDTKVTIVEIGTLSSCEMNIVNELYTNLIPYAYILEDGGQYYILG